MCRPAGESHNKTKMNIQIPAEPKPLYKKAKPLLPTLVVLGAIIFMLTVGNQKTDSVVWNSLGAHAQTEDYTSEIDHLHFGDLLRAEQYEIETVFARAQAIARHEGFYKAGSLAQRNNNPGNLKKSGYPRDSQGHSVFETEIQGWLELYALLYKYNHLTLYELGKFYAVDPQWARGVKRIING